MNKGWILERTKSCGDQNSGTLAPHTGEKQMIRLMEWGFAATGMGLFVWGLVSAFLGH